MVQLNIFTLGTLWATAAISPVVADAQGSLLWDPTHKNEANIYARIIELQHAGPNNGKLLATWEHWYANDAEDSASSNDT